LINNNKCHLWKTVKLIQLLANCVERNFQALQKCNNI
jgi:hypothetical protein